MTINIGDKVISSIDFSNTETAWLIDDAILFLEYLNNNNNTIVLGGDILTKDLNYTYDSWYYNIKSNMDFQKNVNCSIQSANQYISRYIKMNGNNFYVVFVTTQSGDVSRFGTNQILFGINLNDDNHNHNQKS